MKFKDIPYKSSSVLSTIRDDAVWRPLTADFYNYNPNTAIAQLKYFYDSTGVKQYESGHYPGQSWDYYYIVYNQTFTKECWDFEDTITYYNKKGNTIVPTKRLYWDYRYYDVFPADSFYYISYCDMWDDAEKKWMPSSREIISSFDTTLFVLREINLSYYNNGEWIQYDGIRCLREYDEEGRVSSYTGQEWNEQTNEYKSVRKIECIYNEENIETERYQYEYIGENTWQPTLKFTDFEYVEWYPNHQTGIEINILNNEEYTGIAEKRVKIKSSLRWKLNNDNEWEKQYVSNHEWDISGTKSHIDTLFEFYNDVPYLVYVAGELYDERGNYIQRLRERYYPPDEYGNVVLYAGDKYCFHTTYHPLYDYPETKTSWTCIYYPNAQSYDSTFETRRDFYDWWDVRYPVSIVEFEPANVSTLSITPNPVSGVVTISSATEMQQLHIFDITGRLVSSQSPESNKIIFDTGVLPKGVYLVQALLKDGGQQTGKIVVR